MARNPFEELLADLLDRAEKAGPPPAPESGGAPSFVSARARKPPATPAYKALPPCEVTLGAVNVRTGEQRTFPVKTRGYPQLLPPGMLQ